MPPSPGSPPSESNPNQPANRWRSAWFFLGAGFLLLVFSLLVVDALSAESGLSTETRLALIFMLVLLVLGFSAGGIGYVLRRSSAGRPAAPLVLALGLAYFLPALVYLGFSGMLQSIPLAAALQQLSILPGLFPGQPWLFIWQALTLVFWGFSRVSPDRKDYFPFSRPVNLIIPLGLAAGGVFGLAGAFLFSIQTALLETSAAAEIITRSAELPLLVRVVTLVVALTAAPLAEESFFRGELLERWKPRLGGLGAAIATSALFATLQFRPLLWLPAFFTGLGLAALVLRTGKLKTAVIAHAAMNVVMFFLGWYLVY